MGTLILFVFCLKSASRAAVLHTFVQITHCPSGWAAGGDSGKAVTPRVPSRVIWCGSVPSQRKGHSLLFSTKVPSGLASGLDCPYDLLAC